MARSALILLEGHRGNGPLYIQAAKGLGLQPITLSADLAQYDYIGEGDSAAICVDTDDFGAVLHECCRIAAKYGIAGITGSTGFDESLYVTVAKLCRHFNLPGPNPKSIEACCDKFVQRQLLAQQDGIPMPAFRLAGNAIEAKAIALEIGLPVIAKPAVGSGSSGVRLCSDVDELAEHVRHLLSTKRRNSHRILIEEFLEGPQFSVNTMGNTVVAVGAAAFGHPPHFVVQETIFPAPLTGDEYSRITDVSQRCLRALGLGWGPANIEFRWTKRGPVVIEVNPRLPGWVTPRLVQLSYGVDLIAEHVKLLIGAECDLRTKHSHIAAARFLVPDRDGILEMINNDGRAAAIPGVAEVKYYVKPNSRIVRKSNYLDAIGHVIVVSPTRTETAAILRRATDLIRWSIAPFPNIDQDA
ncbi:biotin carboxylase-like ATP-grasp domain-containing protein (plasmid) [Rhizobium etli]|uniref:Biotin carboxylase-like ATP-grasp domain-containing protein n=1 Tax=Rhizobium etli TaxID=29449 RepID=A0AAN1BL79_RHIET|nr:acetyl-CoA carboxylase biotin carboxylase subunit family protein [Rhizobium etli]ARQ13309.1 biotin carboxylase-like ATP-grasp domain-containing protein [Rhizobium etli]